MSKRVRWKLLRDFGLELLVYGGLVVAYALVVLRWLGVPLRRLFDSDLTVYALVALGLIVAQGMVLDFVTSFLLKLLNIGHVEKGG